MYTFCGQLAYLLPFGIFCGHLVNFMVIWYVFPRFGMLYNEKSGKPASNALIMFHLNVIHGIRYKKNTATHQLRTYADEMAEKIVPISTDTPTKTLSSGKVNNQ
jgi:hypothetical protein